MHVMDELRFGGMELGVVKLVNALDRTRIASSICSCRPATSAEQRLAPDIPLVELRRRKGNDPWLVGRLAHVMRRVQPDIVHTHAWGTLCEGLLAARLARVPIVVHGEHGTLNTKPRNVMVQRWAWRQVDQVLSVSSKLAERMAAEIGFPLERIRTIRNGVDLARFRRVDRRVARGRLDLDASELVIGTIGRLVPVKNQALLLAAMAELRTGGVGGTTLIAGDGPLRDDLEARAASAGLASGVRFLGERHDVEQVLAALDVFVLTSASEGLSNTIQEAMAAGLPVVATRVGGAEELVQDGHTGLLVPPDDTEALAAALRRLAHRPGERLAMGLAGRARAEHEFALDDMIAGYQDVYCQLVERRLRRRTSARPAARLSG